VFNCRIADAPGRWFACAQGPYDRELKSLAGWPHPRSLTNFVEGAATLLAGGSRVNSICLVQSEKNSGGICASCGIKQAFQ
jgi:hypothetical protein